jgi:hypothetical protein
MFVKGMLTRQPVYMAHGPFAFWPSLICSLLASETDDIGKSPRLLTS